ncbi:polyprenyl synthetase family protein [Candidatus Latescibacterota bacterium]
MINTISSNEFVSLVRDFILTRTEKIISSYGCKLNPSTLMSGKMLRSMMAARLIESNTTFYEIETLVRACAAVELVHSASLLHDDVIDDGQMRRGIQTLWKVTSPSQAVLTGDLLLCDALDMIQGAREGYYTNSFVSKVREVCEAEIKQELVLRSKKLDDTICMEIARSKTGPFFAFIGLVSGGNDISLSSALEESGYLIGTAYQLADDLIDIVGDEHFFGKTLGSDMSHGKYTIPQNIEAQNVIYERISEICISALDCLSCWPRAQNGIRQFIKTDFQSAFKSIDMEIVISC